MPGGAPPRTAGTRALEDDEFQAAIVAACNRRPLQVVQSIAGSLMSSIAATRVPITVHGTNGEEYCRDMPFPAAATTRQIKDALADMTKIEVEDQRLLFHGHLLGDDEQPFLEMDRACGGGLLVDQAPRTIRLPDSSVFSGQLRRGRFSGMGAMRYANGDLYCGQWEGGVRNGQGHYEHGDSGDIYDGSFQADMRHGHGVLRFSDGDVYDGQFLDDVMHGRGEMRHASGGSYCGQFAGGLHHGTGLQARSDGQTFEGQFHDGLLHGKGRCRLADGSAYEGQFRHGAFEGTGTLCYTDGHTYTGAFVGGMMEGEGVYQSPNRKVVYRGQFVEDAQHGEGTYVSPNGHVYEGQFQDDMPHGHGRMRYADGRVEEGHFEDGCYVCRFLDPQFSCFDPSFRTPTRTRPNIAALGG